ncbi:MAG: HipA domain-containing protein [Blautia sp.]|nr:HipA domain-containing protein [Blautia sp.]
MEDQLKLWDICVFNYLIGNTDNHIKNLSLLYGEDLKTIRLAPAYDIVSTMIYESSTENMALSIDGKYNIYDITRDSFVKEAENVGLGSKIAMKRFDTLVSKFEKAMEGAKKELAEKGFAEVEIIGKQIFNKGGIKNYI